MHTSYIFINMTFKLKLKKKKYCNSSSFFVKLAVCNNLPYIYLLYFSLSNLYSLLPWNILYIGFSYFNTKITQLKSTKLYKTKYEHYRCFVSFRYFLTSIGKFHTSSFLSLLLQIIWNKNTALDVNGVGNIPCYLTYHIKTTITLREVNKYWISCERDQIKWDLGI